MSENQSKKHNSSNLYKKYLSQGLIKESHFESGMLFYAEINKLAQKWRSYFKQLEQTLQLRYLSYILKQATAHQYHNLYTMSKLLKRDGYFHMSLTIFIFLKQYPQQKGLTPYILYYIAKLWLYVNNPQESLRNLLEALLWVEKNQNFSDENLLFKIKSRALLLSIYLDRPIFKDDDQKHCQYFEILHKLAFMNNNQQKQIRIIQQQHEQQLHFIIQQWTKFRKIQYLYPDKTIIELTKIDSNVSKMLIVGQDNINLDTPLLHILLRTGFKRKRQDPPTYIVDYKFDRQCSVIFHILILNLIINLNSQQPIISLDELQTNMNILDDFMQIIPNKIQFIIQLLLDEIEYTNISIFLVSYTLFYISQFEQASHHLKQYHNQFLQIKHQDTIFSTQINQIELQIYKLKLKIDFGLQREKSCLEYLEKAYKLCEQYKLELDDEFKYWSTIIYKSHNKLQKCIYHAKSLQTTIYDEPVQTLLISSIQQMPQDLSSSSIMKDICRNSYNFNISSKESSEFYFVESHSIYQSHRQSLNQQSQIIVTLSDQLAELENILKSVSLDLLNKWNYMKSLCVNNELIGKEELRSKRIELIKQLANTQHSNVILIRVDEKVYVEKQLEVHLKGKNSQEIKQFESIFNEILILLKLKQIKCGFEMLRLIKLYFKVDYINDQTLIYFSILTPHYNQLNCIKDENKIEFVRELLEQVQVLHDNNILHLDLKLSNILCVEKHPIIIDYGSAKIMEDKEIIANSITPEYSAPELDFGIVTSKADIYSLGCAIYKLYTKKTFYLGNPNYKHEIDNEIISSIVEYSTKPYESRYTISELLQFFNKI